MLVDEFKEKPTKMEHKSYESSIFNTVAPEDVTSEVLLGSAYRKLILDYHDRLVNLNDIDTLPSRIPMDQGLGGPETWEMLLQQGGLASPRRRAQQSEKRQLMPLVPEVARYACVLGGVRHRWNPGNLLLQVIGAGCGKSEGELLIRNLGDALKVDKDDDLFARFVARGLATIESLPPPPYLRINLDDAQTQAFRGFFDTSFECTPAERFCKDLGAVITLKNQLTRRQWTVLIEALLRLGIGMHLLWTCHLSYECWQLVLSVAGGQPVPAKSSIDEILWSSHRGMKPLLEFGRDAVPQIKQLILRHLSARFGLNLLLYRLDDVGRSWPSNQIIGYSSKLGSTTSSVIQLFLQHVADNRKDIDSSDPAHWLRSNCTNILNSDIELIRFEAGFTMNMLYAIQYGMGRITATEQEQRAYDQSYLLANPMKRGSRQPSWPVQPAPAMLILLVYACCKSRGDDIPASLEDFLSYLSDYGLYASASELLHGKMGEDLESLGLVVDSPDAAGGRLLVNPFWDLD